MLIMVKLSYRSLILLGLGKDSSVLVLEKNKIEADGDARDETRETRIKVGQVWALAHNCNIYCNLFLLCFLNYPQWYY